MRMKKTLIASLFIAFCATFAHAQLTATWVQGPDGKLIQVWQDGSAEQPAKPAMKKAATAPKNYFNAYAKMFAEAKKASKSDVTGAFAGYLVAANAPEKRLGAVLLGLTYQGEDELSVLIREHKNPRYYLDKTFWGVLNIFAQVYSEEIGELKSTGAETVASWENGMTLDIRKTIDGKLIVREGPAGNPDTYRLFVKELPV